MAKTLKEQEDELNLEETKKFNSTMAQEAKLNLQETKEAERINKQEAKFNLQETQKFEKENKQSVPQNDFIAEKFKNKAPTKFQREIKSRLKVASRVSQRKRIDPLKGFKPTKKKRGPGRPRKYRPVQGSGLPRGRPPRRNISLGGFGVFIDPGFQEPIREPYVPPTQEQVTLLRLFGKKQQFWGYGGNPVRVTRGNPSNARGIIKSGDGGQTGSMFGIHRRG